MAAQQGRILIVEDDATGVVVRYHLQRAGFQALVARTEREAWEILDQWEPDLLVVEGQMPGMAAAAFCRRIRQAAQGAALPIVLLIDSGQGEARELWPLAPLEVIHRPFKPAALVEHISARLARGRVAA
jgi:DNA-binding response OmpR family regulator